MITMFELAEDGKIVNATVWAADPDLPNYIIRPDDTTAWIGDYYRNGRFEREDGTEVPPYTPMPDPEPPADPYERIAALEQQQVEDAQLVVGLYEQQVADAELIADLYEQLYGGEA